MQQWISTFAVMDERETPSLAFLLRKKQQARQALRLYLDQRTVLREKGKKDKETLEAIEKKCATAMRLLSDHFPIPSKALESMEKVRSIIGGASLFLPSLLPSVKANVYVKMEGRFGSVVIVYFQRPRT